jgi:3-oxoacyl-[acyl-carrier protein] reductase
MDLNLVDRVVIVTGGAAGIGRATVERFAAEGARVVAWDVKTDPKVDVTDPVSVQRAVDDVIARYGRIDVLVNNAGIVRDAQLVKWKDGVAGTMDDATFDAVINVNLKGVFLCTRAVVPHMIQARRGVILNASSIVGLYGNFGQTNYAATKAGVISFTKDLVARARALRYPRQRGRPRLHRHGYGPGDAAEDRRVDDRENTSGDAR